MGVICKMEIYLPGNWIRILSFTVRNLYVINCLLASSNRKLDYHNMWQCSFGSPLVAKISVLDASEISEKVPIANYKLTTKSLQ